MVERDRKSVCWSFSNINHAEIQLQNEKVYRSIIGLESMSLFPAADKPLLMHDSNEQVNLTIAKYNWKCFYNYESIASFHPVSKQC